MTETHRISLSHRAHVHGWLIMLSSLIAMATSLRYWGYLTKPVETLTLGYLSLATISQMSLLAIIAGILSLPLLFISVNPLRRTLYALLTSLAICTLLIDTFVFAQYRFHINAIVMKLITSGDVIDFSTVTWIISCTALLLLFSLFYTIVTWLDFKPPIMLGKKGVWFSMLFVMTLLATHGIHIWASAYGIQPITITARYLPLFEPATANRFMEAQEWIDAEAIKRQKTLSFRQPSDLKYPRNPLITEAVSKPTNIMMIVIDSWRADSFTPEVTPTIWDYAKNGEVYNDHYSTGNGTRAGVFGLFYGLPAPYWKPFLANQQSPVLMQRLQALGYKTGIFASAKLSQPEFDSTVFADISDLRAGSEGATPALRDNDLTADWLQWYKQHHGANAPLFSFLFYDGPHGYDFPQSYPHQFKPMLDEVNYLKLDNDFDPQPFLNRYRTSVHYTDSLITTVLDNLKKNGDLKNTLIIITGDHGQEFNDNKLNFWGHNSNFTDAQVKVPFIMLGSGIPSSDPWTSMGAFTSHEDVAPTLLKNFLGLSNPLSDYSTGINLFSQPQKRKWRMAAKFSGYAIIEDQSILEVTALGQYNLLDRSNKPLAKSNINLKVVREALDSLRIFSQ